MAKGTINLGAVVNDGNGDPLRTGGTTINANFDEIYTAIGDGTTLATVGSGDIVGTTGTQTLTNKTISATANTITGLVEADITDLGNYLENINSEPINGLSDVVITTPATGELLKYDGANWINNTLIEAGVVGVTDTQTLTNKTIDTASNTITVVEADISDLQSYLLDVTGEALSTLADVTITAISSGEILKWNGSAWINNTLAEAGIAAASHTHATSDITSGTLTHERGGLETDVSAYSGLVKITGGATSAVTVTTAGEALLGDANAAAQRTTLGLGTLATYNGIVEDTTPQLGGQLDVNGNAIGDGTRELLTFTEDGSAVNHVNIENQATGGGPIISAAGDDTNVDLLLSGKGTGVVKGHREFVTVALSDLTSDLATGTSKAYWRAPYALTILEVRASVLTAPTGSGITVDINDGGTTIMSTNKLTIDATEKTSTTAATAAGITDSAIADDAEVTFDIDAVGSTTTGKGLQVTIIFEAA